MCLVLLNTALVFIEIAIFLRLCILVVFAALASQTVQRKVFERSASSCSPVHESHWIIGVSSLLASKSCPQWQFFVRVACGAGIRLFLSGISCWLFWFPLRVFLCMISIHSLKSCCCFSFRFLLLRRRVTGGMTSASSLYLYHHCRARIGNMLFLVFPILSKGGE